MYFDLYETDLMRLLVSGNTDGTLIAYDLVNNLCLGIIPAHFDSIGAVAINK